MTTFHPRRMKGRKACVFRWRYMERKEGRGPTTRTVWAVNAAAKVSNCFLIIQVSVAIDPDFEFAA
jgi:hypothetical protein